ncbi:hypothetical protein AB1Y20_003386 [Prymnesium parvum]|uniref:Glycoside hydrolase 123-like N-terminal domain-containing protein n=1 Tax=Prymnesium parvum TaxID=97485 RepID=A0AB34JD62_PRYPA
MATRRALVLLGLAAGSLAALRLSRRLEGEREGEAHAPQLSPRHLVAYSVEPWSDASLGNHRAKLLFTGAVGAGSVAWAHVPWRLPGLRVEPAQLQLRSAGGDRLPLHVVSLSSEEVTLLFEPAPCERGAEEVVVAGAPPPAAEESCAFFLYYLPYVRMCETGPSRACMTPYKLSASDRQCAADHGAAVGDRTCCGQRGTLDRADVICPRRAPRCVGYVAGAAWGQCVGGAADTAWARKAAAIAATEGWRGVTPRASVAALQARTARDSFYPMEVAASGAETAAIGALGRALLLFPEGREQPIRMMDRLPLRWVVAGPARANQSRFKGEAARGEFYAFQVGVYAALRPLTLSLSWGELRGQAHGEAIGAERLRCINTPRGTPTVGVGRGEVLPLWFGVDLPADVRPDVYGGWVRVEEAKGGGGAREAVAIELAVGEARVARRGDDEPWRHSRLRWLDSTAGEGGATAEGVQAREGAAALIVRLRGARRLTLGAPLGLPSSLRVGGVELLAEPARLLLLDRGGTLGYSAVRPPRLSRARGGVRWRAEARLHAAGAPLAARVGLAASIADDGLAEMSAELLVERSHVGNLSLSDVRLELPLVGAQVPLINGFDVKGGPRPREVHWKWDAEKPDRDHAQRGLNCRVWLGSAAAGLQLNLQGKEQSDAAASSSCGNDENGQLQCENLSDAQFNIALGSAEWFNGNRGGASILAQTSEGVVTLRVFTGAIRPLQPGERLTLRWRLLLTPVRGGGEPLRADFSTRYFHMQRYVSVDEALAASPVKPWIILHQGNQLIPYINYPFLELDPLRQYIKEAHAKGAKVKLYYTVRELSSNAAELWALRALRGEVIIPSKGKAAGHVWLREHLRINYTAAWHEVLANGEVDAAVQTPAFTSRWDNYWIEGILWLARNLDIDGIYLDGAPYERSILRRLRQALAEEGRGQGFKLDLHASCAGNPHLPYVELYPYLDSLWFGEQCEYKTYSPEQWLAEVSGVPFGLPGEMLGDNSDQWQGLVHGMTCRIYPDPYRCDPRPVWAALDAMGMQRPRLIGWWDEACPVSVATSSTKYNDAGDRGPAVVASVFVSDEQRPPRVAVALANWAAEDVTVRLRANLSALSLLGLVASAPGTQLRLRASNIRGFQQEGSWRVGDELTLRRKGGGENEGFLLELFFAPGELA